MNGTARWRKLVVFDLDGTLAASTAVDEECYVAAVRQELGFAPDVDWSGYRHCTDSGILREAAERQWGRPPSDDETERVRAAFFAALETRLRREPGACRRVPGARRLLSRLSQQGWHVTIATGGWATSARLKLRAAGLPTGLALHSADLAESRQEIVRLAVAGARRTQGVGCYDRVVSVGDGVWDVRTARQMGLPFLGVGRGERADRLRREGAAAVVGDFSDTSATLALLGSVAPPG